MRRRPRKGSIDEAAQIAVALHRGGPEALRAASELLRSDDQLQVRVSTTRKRLYADAAKSAGQSLSAWVLATLDAALSR